MTLQNVIQEVCEHVGVKPETITTKSRKYEQVISRHLIVTIWHSINKEIDPDELMNTLNRERTCFYNSLQKGRNLVRQQPFHREFYEKIIQKKDKIIA